MDLSKVKERDSLSPRREPYWQRLRPGCFLGYRPSAREGAGTWIARAYDEDKRTYRLNAIGDFGGLPAKDRFSAAKKEAEIFAAFIEAGGERRTSIDTVEDACRAYAEGKPEIENRMRRNVYGDPIAKIKLGKLRRHHVKEWRQRLTDKPALVSRNKRGQQRTRVRAPRSTATKLCCGRRWDA